METEGIEGKVVKSKIVEVDTSHESLVASLERVIDLLKNNEIDYLVVHYRPKDNSKPPVSHLTAHGRESLAETVLTLNVLLGNLSEKVMGGQIVLEDQ